MPYYYRYGYGILSLNSCYMIERCCIPLYIKERSSSNSIGKRSPQEGELDLNTGSYHALKDIMVLNDH